MKHFPINVNITDRLTLVVGGGNIACRKVQSLLEYGAKVRVVAPDIVDELAGMGGVELIKREYRQGDMEGACLVICATSSEEVNRTVHEHALAAGLLVNVVDQPHLCTFIFPSVFSRGDLLISASTGGASPTVAKQVRHKLDSAFGPEWGEHIQLLGEIRAELKESSLDIEARSQVAKKLAEPYIREIIRAEGIEKARAAAQQIVDEALGQADQSSR